MGDTAINVPIEIRSHESTQLVRFVEKLVRRFTNREMEQKADELRRVYDEHIYGMSESEADYLSMPIDDWRTLVSNLSYVDDGLRSWWLQTKLVDRLRAKSEAL
jgi:hypothetical protein